MTDTPDQDFFSAAFAEHLKRPPPEFLYHYTDQDGLLGIVGNSSLWATDIRYMNDTTEFGLSRGLIEDRLWKEVEGRLDRDHSERMTMQEFGVEASKLTTTRTRRASILWKFVKQIAGMHIYATCFCECGDLLSQWRGYAASGYGYALGFKIPILKRLHDDPAFLLGKCIYCTLLQQTIVDQAIEYLLDENLCEENLVMNDFVDVLTYGAFFKDPSFIREQEWRLVSISVPREKKEQFRQGKSMIIPHISLDIGAGEKSSLDHIRIGPCPHMALSKDAVRRLLSEMHIKASVKRSSIPFRNW